MKSENDVGFKLLESGSTVKFMVQNDADTFARLEHDLTTCHGSHGFMDFEVQDK